MKRKRKYTHILFDLDHTLWDFERCSTETLKELYQSYQLQSMGCSSAEDFCQVFRQVNHKLWDLYNRGEYDSERLRNERFTLIFDELQLVYDQEFSTLFAQKYLALCPTKAHVMPDTLTTLDVLQKHYQLHIVTNGFSDVQAIKLRSAGLTDYFQTVTTSDEAGYRKPHKLMFQYTLDRIRANPAECIMIGDNLETDIRGAQNADIDHIFFNPEKLTHSFSVDYEISALPELIAIL
uniref:YjjG family noncanonical pyrimidine nucleotidase n=1 Tax=Roseihalotalea indica TaxID=2867963 RepID=A0AA49GSU4_9BACT|nr:YjjG family noncanonical pyrimidine nucleotidase [Tunicatimonas sp. TK19036]